MAIEIVQATVDDLPELARINTSAYRRETTAQFAFKNWPDDENMMAFLRARIADRFDHPTTRIFKAVEGTDNAIKGFICWTLEEGVEAGIGFREPTAEPTPTGRILQQLPPYLDLDFVISTAAEIEQLKSLMGGKQHYYLSAFAVEVQSQGAGIGSRLLDHCLHIADQEKMRTWLISFPGSHGLYSRKGFKDVDYRDTDLNAWDKGKLRGYGVYRSYAMVREARTA